jgi:hypothetical protein
MDSRPSCRSSTIAERAHPVDGAAMMQGMQDGRDGYTGRPSLLHEIVTLGAKALKVLFTPSERARRGPLKIPLLTDGSPLTEVWT